MLNEIYRKKEFILAFEFIRIKVILYSIVDMLKKFNILNYSHTG